MSQRTVRFSVALFALALAACGGAVERAGVTSRVARAASRTVVDTIMEAEVKSASQEPDLEPGRPLALSESRPNAILDGTLAEPLGTLATEAMAGIPSGPVSETENENVRTDVARMAPAGLDPPKPPCHHPPRATRVSS